MSCKKNKNHNETLLRIHKNGSNPKDIIRVGENAEKLDPHT